MTSRKSMTMAILTGLVAAAAAIYAATRVWESTSRDRPAPLPPVVVESTGAQLWVWAVPAGAVAVAGVIAVLAASGFARRVVSVCVGLAGLGLMAAGAAGAVEAFGGWPVVTTVMGAAVTAVAVWTWRDGVNWPAMSARYDRTADKTVEPLAIAEDPDALWDALDRGMDPTSPSIGETAPGEECAR